MNIYYELEIDCCRNCYFFKVMGFGNYGYCNCVYYNSNIPEDCFFLPESKPEFCKVKSVLVKEGQ